MSVDRNLTFWIAVLAVFIFLLWLLNGILLPFVAGIALAYIRAPLADRLERLGMSRSVAALLITSAVMLAIILLAAVLVPILSEQALALISKLPGYLTRLQATLADAGSPWLKRMFGNDLNNAVPELAKHAASYLTQLLDSLWSGGKAMVSFLSILVIMPVISFYLLRDWHQMIETLDSRIPLENRNTVHQIVGEIDAAISGILRGQIDVGIIVALYYAIALSMPGLDSAVLTALANGVLSFKPYVGSTCGF